MDATFVRDESRKVGLSKRQPRDSVCLNRISHTGKGSAACAREVSSKGCDSTPEEYESRLIEMFPGAFEHLRLFGLDPYDLALSKIERNSQRDRDDVRHLARVVPLDLEILRQRFHEEIRPNLAIPERESLTLQLWIAVIEEERAESRV